MDYNDDEALASTQDRSRNISTVNPSIMLWGGGALALAIFAIVFNTSAIVLGASLLAKIFSVVVATALGTVGALFGNAIRKFAQPDAVFTRGGIGSLIWLRLFWSVGPQCIGLFAGVFIGIGMVLGL
jgi:hypothetical protein